MNKKFTLRELSKMLSCQMIGDPEYTISGVNSINDAKQDELTFYTGSTSTPQFEESLAGIICTNKEYQTRKGRNYLISDDPEDLFESAAKIICHNAMISGFKSIHPTAVVHQSAKIGKNVELGPFVVIDRDCIIGENTKIYAHTTIGPKTKIGNECMIHSNVTIRENCSIGNRVILQPGCVIGACGYGYRQNASNEHKKLIHYAGVTLEDDVEVGANATIDRGRLKDTLVKKGVKIDNLVMIAHNSKIGENTLVIAQAGIAGSTTIGKNCIIAAQAGVVQHVELADQVIIGAQSAASKTISKPGAFGGAMPTRPVNEYRRQVAHIYRLDQYVKVLTSLRKRVEELEKATETKGAC